MTISLRHAFTAAVAALLLVGCATTDGEPASDADTGSEQANDTDDVVIGDGSQAAMPEIAGEYGEAPEFTWPAEDPSADLQVQVLSEGEGPVVPEGGSVAANYAGYVWGSEEPFDTSYGEGPRYFPLGGVVRGWSLGIPNHPVGSRLLITIPPDLGYGEEGNPNAGIGGQDTIAFVVDVVDAFAYDALGEADAKAVDLPGDVPVDVEGEPGQVPTLTIVDGAPEPTESAAYPLTEGSGEPVALTDEVTLSYVLTTWDNAEQVATWMPELGPQGGPQRFPMGVDPTFDLIEGMPTGSRVLLLQEATEEGPALAIVADILAAG